VGGVVERGEIVGTPSWICVKVTVEVGHFRDEYIHSLKAVIKLIFS
jgi:hypothetical protein